MINEENLNKLYNGVSEGTELTTKQLNEYGFNSKNLNELIQKGSIERIKRGLYSFKSVDELFYYGKTLIIEKKYEMATLCFEKCFELDPTHLGVCVQLFLRSIQKEDYQRAFKLYENLSQAKNKFYNIDANYYLYLLSIITELPEKHREYARYLKLEDIKIPLPDKRYKDIPLQNKVRITVSQRRFSYALKQLNALITKHGNLTVQDIITRTLLLRAINAEKISRNTIVSLIKEKKYNEVVDHLLEKQGRHNLSISEEYILRLVRQIIKMQESSKIPERKMIQAENLLEAIEANDYNIALRLSTEYNEKNHISNNSNAINLLLNDICILINTLSKSKQVEKSKEEQQQSKTSSTKSEITFSSIISYLMKNELDKAFSSLRTYMKSIGKAEFEFLIVDLIKISLLEKDITFTKPMTALTLISKKNYSFDIASYIQEFYVTLSQNRFEEARIYLDMISKANKLGQDCIITDGLYQVLESSEKILNYKRDNSVLIATEKAIEDSKQERLIDTPIVSTTSTEQPKLEVKQNKILQEQDSSEKELIAKKYEELVERKGVILLKPMDEARITRILNMVEEYSDMVAFKIGKGNKQQVVLRYKPTIEEAIDVKNLISLGNQAYSDRNYNKCIEVYLQLLQIFKEPRAITYSKLGLSYLKKWNKSLAIDYLTIATELSKKEQGDLDFTDLISKLKGDISKEDTKSKFKMNQNDFEYSSVNNFYGIENFEEINAYISKSGMDVESACHQLEMTPEEIDIIKIIYAREFYIQGNLNKGDLFLKSVERSKEKTRKTIKLLEEVRRNKKFYPNRQSDTPRQLILSLTPKKK